MQLKHFCIPYESFQVSGAILFFPSWVYHSSRTSTDLFVIVRNKKQIPIYLELPASLYRIQFLLWNVIAYVLRL